MAGERKKISAKQILNLMHKAPPSNAVKLTSFDYYYRVPYQEFFAEFPNLDVSPEKRAQLEVLKDEMVHFEMDPDLSYREDKLYVYFILRLQEILYDRY